MEIKWSRCTGLLGRPAGLAAAGRGECGISRAPCSKRKDAGEATCKLHITKGCELGGQGPRGKAFLRLASSEKILLKIPTSPSARSPPGPRNCGKKHRNSGCTPSVLDTTLDISYKSLLITIHPRSGTESWLQAPYGGMRLAAWPQEAPTGKEEKVQDTEWSPHGQALPVLAHSSGTRSRNQWLMGVGVQYPSSLASWVGSL